MQCVLLLQISNMSLLSKYIRISNTRLAPVHSCVLEYPTHSLTHTPVIGGTIYQCSFSDCDSCDYCDQRSRISSLRQTHQCINVIVGTRSRNGHFPIWLVYKWRLSLCYMQNPKYIYVHLLQFINLTICSTLLHSFCGWFLPIRRVF